MAKMISYSGNGEWLKCKRCRNEFLVETNSYYSRTVCFCPFCGQERENHKNHKPSNVGPQSIIKKEQTMDEWWAEHNDPVDIFLANRETERRHST